MVTLDIKNAFNSVSWQAIADALSERQIHPSLQRIVESYLTNRSLLVECENKIERYRINSEVPQGSVLVPTLWNIIYDNVLAQIKQEGGTVIGYADDLAVVVVARSEAELENRMNSMLRRIAEFLDTKQLEVAPQKTEAMMLTGRKKIRPVSFEIKRVTITPKRDLKYLGVNLDQSIAFGKHIEAVAQKATKTAAALAKLMPRVGGPKSSKRKTINATVQLIILYAAPVWARAIKVDSYNKRLSAVQRKLAIATSSAYRTVSQETVLVVSNMIPIDILVGERVYLFENKNTPKAILREKSLEEWQVRWQTTGRAAWTRQLIPDVRTWHRRKFGDTNYFTTHGCFGSYLARIGKRETADCWYCGEEDSIGHTLFECRRWAHERLCTEVELGKSITPLNLVEQMLHSQANWSNISTFIFEIMKQKLKDERTKEL